MKLGDPNPQLNSGQAQQVVRSYCAPNVRFAAWLVFLSLNTVFICSFLSVLTYHQLDDQPVVRAVFAVFWLLFGLAILLFTIRFLRAKVIVQGGKVQVRNVWRSHDVDVGQVEELGFGFPAGEAPDPSEAGSLFLKNGDSLRAIALGRAVFRSSTATRKHQLALDGLNHAIELDSKVL